MKMKMYIIVREEVPLHVAINSVGHAALGTYLKFKDHEETQEWLETSFNKVTCKANPKEFELAKTMDDYLLIREAKFNNEEICIGFRPRKEWHKFFKYLRLYSQEGNQ